MTIFFNIFSHIFYNNVYLFDYKAVLLKINFIKYWLFYYYKYDF